jgi:hypothetical protein
MQTCMLERVGDTLSAIRALASPVVRSCHVGNNTSNNWGWLALGGNTRHVQYDHTLYGVDENSSPWLLLGHAGRVIASYDYRGRSRLEDVGRHLNEVMGRIERKHRSILNYGIFAGHEGTDLISSQVALAKALARGINGSELSFDSSELLAQPALLDAVIGDLADCRRLALVFDRWVESTRAGHVIVTPLRELVQSGPRSLRLVAADGGVPFDGTLSELLAAFRAGLEAVHRRLHEGHRFDRVAYPWVSLSFSYLWATVTEHAVDPSQDEFWHAGGSASQYYINTPALARPLVSTCAALAEVGHLPMGARVKLIPSFCAQLFATTGSGMAMLTRMLERWHAALATIGDLDEIGAQLQVSSAPLEVVRPFVARLDTELRTELEAMLAEFNQVEATRLPVAHVVASDDPTYNKYGAPQQALVDRTIQFPAAIYESRWFELDLLVKTLAELTRGHFG